MSKNTRETKDMPLLAPVVAQDDKKLHYLFQGYSEVAVKAISKIYSHILFTK